MKALKYMVVTILGLVVLAILTLVGVALFVNPNHFKAQMSAAVAKATGRQLDIAGNIRWSFFPWLGIGIEDVRLSNASGFGASPFATLGEVDVSVKLLPLLHGAFDIGTIKLSDLQVSLVKQANGKTNWSDLMNHASQSSDQNTSVVNSPKSTAVTSDHLKALSAKLHVDTIIVNNATISWQDLQNKINKTIAIDTLKSNNLNADGKPFDLFFALKLISPENKQPYDLSLSSNITLDANAQTLNVSKFVLGLNNMQLSGNLQVTSIFKSPSYQVQFNMPKTDIAKWLASLGLPIHFQDNNALRNVTLNGDVSGSMTALHVTNLQAMLDGSAIQANLELSHMPHFVGKFNITADGLNVDKYKLQSNQPAMTNASNNKPVKASGITGPHLPDGLLTGHINIGTLKVNKLAIQQLNVDIAMKDQKLTLSPLTATIYGGQLSAMVGADLSGRIPYYRLDETLTGTALGPMLHDLNGKSDISGTLNLKANVSGTGVNADAVLRSLSGEGGFSVQAGQIPGLNIAQTLVSVASVIFKQAAVTTENGTSFSDLSATFAVRDGVLNSNNLVLNSPLFTVTGVGSIDIPTQGLSWQIRVNPLGASIPQIAQLTKAIGGTVPLDVGGTLSDPKVTADMPTILASIGKDKLSKGLQKIGDQLNKGSKDLGKSIKSLFN